MIRTLVRFLCFGYAIGWNPFPRGLVLCIQFRFFFSLQFRVKHNRACIIVQRHSYSLEMFSFSWASIHGHVNMHQSLSTTDLYFWHCFHIMCPAFLEKQSSSFNFAKFNTIYFSISVGHRRPSHSQGSR